MPKTTREEFIAWAVKHKGCMVKNLGDNDRVGIVGAYDNRQGYPILGRLGGALIREDGSDGANYTIVIKGALHGFFIYDLSKVVVLARPRKKPIEVPPDVPWPTRTVTEGLASLLETERRLSYGRG